MPNTALPSFPRARLASTLLAAALLWQGLHAVAAPSIQPGVPQTERSYLSGLGPKDALPWEFSVTGGRRAGEWSTIAVPSNWEQQGFGSYDYGESRRQVNEHGLYRLRFAVPPEWKTRKVRLVFDGVMTDATVKVNGQQVGPTHMGGFYRFAFDLDTVLKYGAQPDNLLEVDVAKISSDKLTAGAENKGDYWNFGGIFRPVWLEAAPRQAIEHTAIDARADGSLAAVLTLADAPAGSVVEGQIYGAGGKPVGRPFSQPVTGSSMTLRTKVAAPLLWSAETPNLHSVRLTLRKGGDKLHTSTTRFGFRTFEVRKGDGLYLNGKRIMIKGVNRHSFRPDTGRSLNREDNYADARLIKQMNMNTARMSHYPPDEAFLEAADELGLYVLDELSGWQRAHGTEVGKRLVREMITRDVNHPSILFWDNGNEGGWNTALDGEFAKYDPQQRAVLHPWALHDDIDTKHYSSYADLSKRLQGPHLLMPTEVLHALYDGGGGAGLDDYWKAISASPVGAGMIFWVFADEGIARTDKAGKIDVFSTYAPDGLVGPRHEKEGSFYTVRQLWSPVLLTAPAIDERFAGKLAVENHYDFTSLDKLRFDWQLVRYRDPQDKTSTPQVLASGRGRAPKVAPGAKGELDLKLPAGWRQKQGDALLLTAYGPDQQAVWTWSFATPALARRLATLAPAPQGVQPRRELADGRIELSAGAVKASFDAASGSLIELREGGQVSALRNGPRLVYARPAAGAAIDWLPFVSEDNVTRTYSLAKAALANTIEIDAMIDRSLPYAQFKLEISADGQNWKTLFDASRRDGDGKRYDFPPQAVLAVRTSGFSSAEGEPISVRSLRLGYAAARFAPASAAATVRSGAGTDAASGKPVAWVEADGANGLQTLRWSLHADGSLQLDYRYTLDGAFRYHGISFDHAETAMRSLRWLGEGPFRSWQNRTHGVTLGVYENAYQDLQPGSAWGYPEFQGFFAGVRWARLNTSSGPLTVTSPDAAGYLRVGTPRISHEHTSVEFPAGDLSFMHAIPPIGSKFLFPEQMGPGGQPASASGDYRGTLLFRFGH